MKKKTIFIIAIVIISLVAIASICTYKYSNTKNLTVVNKEPITTQEKTNNKQELSTKEQQALKSNFYNWLVFYEGEINDERTAHQLSLLSDNVHIKSISGEINSKAEYEKIIPNYKGTKNAHKVKNISISQNKDDYILTAELDFAGINTKGEQNNYTLLYNTKSKKSGKDFVFTDINISVKSKNEKTDFVSTYAENRGQALLNEWNSHIEALDGNTEPFKELLAENFALHFPSGTVDSWEKFDIWLNGAPTALKKSSHIVPYFSAKKTGENSYVLTIHFDWIGIKKDDSKMEMHTKHTWKIIDNVNEKFAKLVDMGIEMRK